MSGVHGLQQVVSAFITDLTHDDPVWTMAKSSSNQLAWGDGNLARNGSYSFPSNGIRMGYLQLRWLLDHDESFPQRNMVKERLHQRGLTRPGSSTDDAVLTLQDEFDDIIANNGRKAARSYQLIAGEPTIEFADGQRRSVDRRRRADDGHA